MENETKFSELTKVDRGQVHRGDTPGDFSVILIENTKKKKRKCLISPTNRF